MSSRIKDLYDADEADVDYFLNEQLKYDFENCTMSIQYNMMILNDIIWPNSSISRDKILKLKFYDIKQIKWPVRVLFYGEKLNQKTQQIEQFVLPTTEEENIKHKYFFEKIIGKQLTLTIAIKDFKTIPIEWFVQNICSMFIFCVQFYNIDFTINNNSEFFNQLNHRRIFQGTFHYEFYNCKITKEQLKIAMDLKGVQYWPKLIMNFDEKTPLTFCYREIERHYIDIIQLKNCIINSKNLERLLNIIEHTKGMYQLKIEQCLIEADMSKMIYNEDKFRCFLHQIQHLELIDCNLQDKDTLKFFMLTHNRPIKNQIINFSNNQIKLKTIYDWEYIFEQFQSLTTLILTGNPIENIEQLQTCQTKIKIIF